MGPQPRGGRGALKAQGQCQAKEPCSGSTPQTPAEAPQEDQSRKRVLCALVGLSLCPLPLSRVKTGPRSSEEPTAPSAVCIGLSPPAPPALNSKCSAEHHSPSRGLDYDKTEKGPST